MARNDSLPQVPCSGTGCSQTSKDWLFGDIMEWLKKRKLGFPINTCQYEGVYVIRSLVTALWAIDVCHSA